MNTQQHFSFPQQLVIGIGKILRKLTYVIHYLGLSTSIALILIYLYLWDMIRMIRFYLTRETDSN